MAIIWKHDGDHYEPTLTKDDTAKIVATWILSTAFEVALVCWMLRTVAQ